MEENTTLPSNIYSSEKTLLLELYGCPLGEKTFKKGFRVLLSLTVKHIKTWDEKNGRKAMCPFSENNGGKLLYTVKKNILQYLYFT